MPRGHSAWNLFVTPYMREARRQGHDVGEAMRQASRDWHAGKHGGKHVESNPGGFDPVKVVLGVGVGYLVLNAVPGGPQLLTSLFGNTPLGPPLRQAGLLPPLGK